MGKTNVYLRGARQGYRLVNNVLRRRLFHVNLFTTDRCNSRCLTCGIWRKEPKKDLDVEVIKELLTDKIVDRSTYFNLTGGEFLLHPKYKEILSLVSDRNYAIYSNGILADRLIETVRAFKVKSLSLSLDGTPDTYKRVRGADNYYNIERIVNELKSETDIFISYTINPWNTRQDLLHVIEFCRKNGITLNVAYYSDIEYFDATGKEPLYQADDLISHPYLRLYDSWLSGNLRLPCYSIRGRCVVRPNGDVDLCEQKEIKLGNLYQQKLGDILNSKRVIDIQNEYLNCNACWIGCQRTIDIELTSLLKSFIPNPLLNRFLGTYEWQKLPNLWQYIRDWRTRQ